MNWFLGLFQHRHNWVDTATNPHMITTEQQCSKCGKFRHDLFQHIHSNARNWQPGRHPQGTHPVAKTYVPEVKKHSKPQLLVCADCNHFKESWCAITEVRHWINGEKDQNLCMNARDDERMCGREGKWFEPKPK